MSEDHLYSGASREEIRKKKLAKRKREQRIRGAFIILLVLLSFVNVGFGIINLNALLKERNQQEDPPAAAVDTAADTKEDKPEQTADTPEAEDTDPAEPEQTEPSVSETPEAAEPENEEPAVPDEPENTDAADSGKTQSELESDPRFTVTAKYEPIGVIHNVNNFLNIRKSPDPSAVTIGKAMRNSAVTVLEKEDNGWLRIRSGENEGYVSGEFVATEEEGEVLAMEYCKNNAFAKRETLPSGDGLPVYRSANKNEEVVFMINPENGYRVLDILGSWVKIQITEGLSGYVERDHVDVRYTLEEPIFFGNDQNVSELRLGIVNKAFEYYGGSYVWGGIDLATGVDCSGFTLRIYESFGINLPRLSSEQAKWGSAVGSMAEALPGDLLFFHGYRNGTVTPGVGHVAIYIGNGKMIHAASEARGIVADNYNYLGEPVGIRRVISPQAEAAYKGNQ